MSAARQAFASYRFKASPDGLFLSMEFDRIDGETVRVALPAHLVEAFSAAMSKEMHAMLDNLQRSRAGFGRRTSS